jgi:hypothetical protein
MMDLVFIDSLKIQTMKIIREPTKMVFGKLETKMKASRRDSK